MDVIDVNSRKLQEVELQGHYGVFTELRVDRSTVPEGVNCYEFRYGDDDSYPAALEENVRVNYYGAEAFEAYQQSAKAETEMVSEAKVQEVQGKSR